MFLPFFFFSSNGFNLLAPLRDGANTVVQLSDRAVPCGVCEVEGTTDVITIVGTTACPSAYRREYYGWAVAGDHDTVARQSTICLHHEAEETTNSPEKSISQSGWPGLYPMELEAEPSVYSHHI